MSKKALLAILDGWGLGTDPEISAIARANTPFMDSLLRDFPNATLEASGLAVGLPAGQMGNSEVGHMNLGAGRVVYQNLVRLNIAAADGTLGHEEPVQQLFKYAKDNNKKLHLMGLASDGGVHSHINHLKALLTAAAEFGLTNVHVHAFTDGRDTDPHSGYGFIEDLIAHMRQTTGRLQTVVGRFYAMDRDQRWDRIKIAYDAMVNGMGTQTRDPLKSIRDSYESGVSDEFISPIVVTSNTVPVGTIGPEDAVLCFNFRTDRAREITEALTQRNIPDFKLKKLPLYYLMMTNYDDSFLDVKSVYDDETLSQTLGEILAEHGKTQIRVAETEKYPHVTFFFSGGREEPFEGERRILCPSPKDVATYDKKPQMSAPDITEKILPEIKKETADFICLNYANADMVGHTGSMEAAIKACETVDSCLRELATAAYEHGYTVFVLADHGNSDIMVNADGTPNTQHTTNLVPFFVMDKNRRWEVSSGKLGDVAPTILHAMDIPIPTEMTGTVLIK